MHMHPCSGGVLGRQPHMPAWLHSVRRVPQAGTLERRLFYLPSFKIYGSVAGFYDYGPPGCAIKQNMTQVRARTAPHAPARA